MPLPGQAIKERVRLGKSPDACWTWCGPVTNGGYGHLTFCGRDVLAHRWIWEQLFGPIPDGLVVYSTCESKACINPHHLACGTQAQACRQSVQTKLMPADVSEIRAARRNSSPLTAQQLAARFDVSPQTIHDIWRGDAWSAPRKNRGPKRPRNQHGDAIVRRAA